MVVEGDLVVEFGAVVGIEVVLEVVEDDFEVMKRKTVD